MVAHPRSGAPPKRWPMRFVEGKTLIYQTYFCRGRKYKVCNAGKRLLTLLREVQYALFSGESFLALRPQIRAVIRSTPPHLLSYLIANNSQPLRARLLIWIAAKSHEQSSTTSVDRRRHWEHEDPKLRRATVRALRRLSAWRQLRNIAEKCKYEDTRAEAARLSQRRSFDDRLTAATTLMRSRKVAPTATELVVRPEVEMRGRHPPKNRRQIRRFVRRVQWWFYRSRQRRLAWCGQFFKQR